MKNLKCITVYCNDRVIGGTIRIADTFISRFKGLMGVKKLDKGEGLLLNCSSVHCFFMKIPIDVVYLSGDYSVIDKETIKPWRVGKILRGVKYVLELPCGAADFVASGSKLVLE